MTLAVAKAFVPQAKNGWEFTLDAIGRYYEQVVAEVAQGHNPSVTPAVGPLKPAHHHPPAEATEHVGTYLESARLLGVRTAELHLALASGAPGSEFSVEPMTPQYLRGTVPIHAFPGLAKSAPAARADENAAAGSGSRRPARPRTGTGHPPAISPTGRNNTLRRGRIRIHGDLQLGQVLWTGRDFVFLDFEGDATRPISERRIKRSPLRDMARMLRSFHHATYAGFHQQAERGVISPENLPQIRAVGPALEPGGEPRVFAGILPRPAPFGHSSPATRTNCK